MRKLTISLSIMLVAGGHVLAQNGFDLDILNSASKKKETEHLWITDKTKLLPNNSSWFLGSLKPFKEGSSDIECLNDKSVYGIIYINDKQYDYYDLISREREFVIPGGAKIRAHCSNVMFTVTNKSMEELDREAGY